MTQRTAPPPSSSMNAAYIPRPGSLSFRAIAWLETQGAGAEATASMIAGALGTSAAAVNGGLSNALDAGALFSRQKVPDNPRAPLWYSLVDHASRKARELDRLMMGRVGRGG